MHIRYTYTYIYTDTRGQSHMARRTIYDTRGLDNLYIYIYMYIYTYTNIYIYTYTYIDNLI
jgi:hypothetical protein